MDNQTDVAAVERVRAIVGRSRLDRITADMLWNAQTAEELRSIIRVRLPACPLKTALLAACGPAEAA